MKIFDNYRRFGGGIYARDHSKVDLINSTINNNSARNGGGIGCSRGSAITIYGTEITANTTDANEITGFGLGGGIHADDCELNIGSSSLQKTRITNNIASVSGGGLYASEGSKVTIKDATNKKDVIVIANNSVERAVSSTSLDNVDGGGITIVGTGTVLHATNLRLINNSADFTGIPAGTGGAISVRSGASFTMQIDKSENNCGASSIPNNTMCNQIINNSARSAGVINLKSATATISQTYIAKNTVTTASTDSFILAYILDADLTMQNNIFVNNGFPENNNHHLFRSSLSDLYFAYNTFINNYSYKYFQSTFEDSITFKNSIITYENPSDTLLVNFSNTSLDFSCLLLNNNDAVVAGDNITMQVDTATLFQTTWPYHLKQGALAVNKCNPTGNVELPDIDFDHPVSSQFRDAGADKYKFTDFIFANGFEQSN